MKSYKEAISQFKQDIKNLAAQQHNLKQQRKTVHFHGERIYTPSVAAQRHLLNRHELRHMYAAYAIARSKSTLEQEKAKTDISENHINQLLVKYAYGTTVCDNA